MFQNIFLDFLFIMSMRFFFFDFYLFQPIWKKLKNTKNYFICKFLNCPFCQGFWLALIYFSIFSNFYYLSIIGLSFISAFVNYVYYFLTFKLFYKSEKFKMVTL